MKLTIAVCTYNRFDWLGKCLDAINKQTLSKNEYKILVIDNSLNPEQSRAFKDSLEGFSNLEYVITERCGIGYARTVAMENCSTEFLAFTDDDCLVPADWAKNILKAFERHGEGVGIIGGRVLPDWETQRPDWLDDDLLAPLGMIDWGDEDVFINHDEYQWLLTANAAYRTEVLRKIGGFSSHLGRRRNLPLAHEEFTANEAINSLGYDLVYSPLLSVQHFVPTKRANQKMFCRDAFWEHVSQVLIRSRNVDAEDVDQLAEIVLPMQKQLLADFVDFSSSEELKQKIAQVRYKGFQAAKENIGSKFTGKETYELRSSVIYVVTPCFNAARTIDQTIASVASQAGDFSIRYHIQDGGSTDDTIVKIEQWEQRLNDGSFPIFCKNIVFTYKSEPDQGMYDAITKGFATMFIPPASFMGWINADDLFFPAAFDQVAYVDKNFKSISWLGGKPAVIDEQHKRWQMPERLLPNKVIRQGLCDGQHWNFVQQEGSFFRCNLWNSAMEKETFTGFKLGGDWNLWRIFAHETQYYQLSWPLGAFRRHKGQLSQEKFKEYMAEIDAVLSPEDRLNSFMELNVLENLWVYLIKEDLKSGELVAIKEDGKAEYDYYRNKITHPELVEPHEDENEPVLLEKPSRTRIVLQAKPDDSAHHDIYPDPAKIILGPGWHRVEGISDNWWVWSPNKGIVHFKTDRGGRYKISLSILSLHQENMIHLRLNGHNVAQIPAGLDETIIPPITIRLRKGTNILEFHSDKEAIASQKDTRPLNFMIKNLNFHSLMRLLPINGLSPSIWKLKQSGMFYSGFYKKQVPELGQMNPLEHYCLYGAWENKNPNPLFDSAFYLKKNKDVHISGENPLLHYIRHGWKEGRDPHPRFNTTRYMNAYPEARQFARNPLFHYLKYGILKNYDPLPPPKIDPEHFQDFTFSMRSHWKLFSGYDKNLYGKTINMDDCTLKEYQDLLVFAFIKDHISPGSRILDVGGGLSRILEYFADTYDCWNIDKMEGIGNGPKGGGKFPFKLVLDYMGNFNSELPDGSFDFVFSISALEHTPEDDPGLFDKITQDINRVLKPGGYSLHLFDVLFNSNDAVFKNGGGLWTNGLVHNIFNSQDTLNAWVDPEPAKDNPDLYYMNEISYNKTWFHTTKRKYLEFGRPASLNILWQKPI